MRVRSTLLKCVGLALFAWILTLIDREALLRTCLRAEAPALLGAAALFYPIILAKSFRLKALFGRQRAPFGLGEAFGAYTASHFAGAVTPGRVGELSRIGYLRHMGLSAGEAAFGVVLEKIVDILVLVGLAGVGVLLLGPSLRLNTNLPALLIGVAGVALVVIIFFRYTRAAHGLNRWLPEGIRRRVARVGDGFAAGLLRLRWSDSMHVGIWTLLAWGLACVQVLLLGRALGLTLTPAYLIGAYAVSSLAALLPVTVAGMGTRDASLVVLFGLAGAPREAAVALSLSLLLLYLVQGLESLPFWLRWTPGARAWRVVGAAAPR